MAQLSLPGLSLFILAVCIVSSDAVYLGRCPIVEPKTDFDIRYVVGRWYEYAKYSVATESGSKCITNFFSYTPTSPVTLVRFLTNAITGVQTGITASTDVVGPGILRITADGRTGLLGNINVAVLDSDYSGFLVLYSCTDVLLGLFHNRYAYVLTRQRQPDDNAINNAKAALLNNGLLVQDLINTDQSDCSNGVKTVEQNVEG